MVGLGTDVAAESSAKLFRSKKAMPAPRLTSYLLETGCFSEAPFSLVDVGVSGGLDARWRHFGDSLEAIGFDPLVKEIERLAGAERNPAVRYVASYVGYHKIPRAPRADIFNLDPLARTSAARAASLLQTDYTKTFYDQTH